MPSIKEFLSVTLSFRHLVSRSQYLKIGLIFTVIKYAGDAFLIWKANGFWVMPWAYFNPLIVQRWADNEVVTQPLIWVSFLWSIPFLVIGFSATLRRTIDAGWDPWWTFLFFIPGLNLIFMAVLCFVPTSPKVSWVDKRPEEGKVSAKSGILAGAATAAVCVVVTAIFIYFFRSYSGALFIGLPFVFGFTLTLILNFEKRVPLSKSLLLIVASLAFTGGMLLAFAIEGLLCIGMAIPPFLALSFLGAFFAHQLCLHWAPRAKSSLSLYSFFLIPLMAQPFLEIRESVQGDELREVVSSVEINAAPEKVWPHVIQFSELPAATEWYFRYGVAHPLRAVIEGTGVGAVRRCQFSTGDFVEPITEWQEPHRLSFDVQFQPHALKELSPYQQIYAPHLDHFLESQKGQFRLVALPDGRTRIEGSTWYRTNIHPTFYWNLFADYFIHRIHLRVLGHIRNEVESSKG